jgi:hypothetical protein
MATEITINNAHYNICLFITESTPSGGRPAWALAPFLSLHRVLTVAKPTTHNILVATLTHHHYYCYVTGKNPVGPCPPPIWFYFRGDSQDGA